MGTAIRIILTITVVLLCLTSTSCGQSQAELTKAKSEVANLQDQLTKAQDDLKANQSKLTSSETNLKETQDKLNKATTELEAIKKELDSSKKEFEDAKSELKLYKETLGTTVYSNITPPYKTNDTDRLSLIRNDKAINPTRDQLLTFITNDKTDLKPLVPGKYMNPSYAMDIFNNAQAAGIRAAFVVVRFSDRSGAWALNAFRTTDAGLIYIDCTGYQTPLKSCDKIASAVQKGKLLNFVPMGTGDFAWQSLGIVSSIEIYW